VPLAIPIVVLLALLVSVGMASAQRPISGGFIKWASHAFAKIPLLGGFTIEQIVRMDRYITHQLGRFFNAVEHHGVKWFTELGHYVQVMGYWSTAWSGVLTTEIKFLRRYVIPRAIKARTQPIARQAAAAEAQAKAAAGIAHRVPKVVKAHDRIVPVTKIERVAMPHAAEWAWIHKHYAELQHTVLGAATEAIAVPLPHAPAWVGRTARQVRAHQRRLARIEALLGIGAIAALLARTLGVSVKCARPGGNLGRIARSICGAPSWLIRFIVAGAIEAFAVADLCEFTHLLSLATKSQRPALMELVSVEDALIGCHGTIKPLVFDLPPADLPPLQGVSPLAA
jgi:hypothetical protein